MSPPPCSFIMKLPQTDLEAVEPDEEALEPQKPEPDQSLPSCYCYCSSQVFPQGWKFWLAWWPLISGPDTSFIRWRGLCRERSVRTCGHAETQTEPWERTNTPHFRSLSHTPCMHLWSHPNGHGQRHRYIQISPYRSGWRKTGPVFSFYTWNKPPQTAAPLILQTVGAGVFDHNCQLDSVWEISHFAWLCSSRKPLKLVNVWEGKSPARGDPDALV